MNKKFLIILIAIAILVTLKIYKDSNATVECWWGTLYPSLSTSAIIEEEPIIANANVEYYEGYGSKSIKYDFFLIEWFKQLWERLFL